MIVRRLISSMKWKRSFKILRTYHYICVIFLEGQSLPVACNPTTSRNDSRVQLTSASKKPLPKVMNARHLSGGKKTKETIDIQKSVEPQQIYRPAPGSMFNLLFVLGNLFLDLLTLPFFWAGCLDFLSVVKVVVMNG